MKKIFCLIVLLIAFNVFAQPLATLNLPAVMEGKTPDIVCFLYSFPGDAEKLKSAACGNRNGLNMALNLNVTVQRTIIDFIGSGDWNLASTFLAKNNITTFVFTKK
ncbi:MAG: hypothetical protein ACHQYQ_03540 [Bacteriovoracales bacterium]